MVQLIGSSRRVLVTAAVMVAFGGLVAGCAQAAPASPSKPNNNGAGGASIEQQFQDKLAARPAAGTPEYTKLAVDPLLIPYVKGQPSSAVVTELQKSENLFFEEGYADAPQSHAELIKWEFDESKSADDVVDELNLPYFDAGAETAWFGPNNDNNTFQANLLKNFSPTHNARVAAMLVGHDPKHAEVANVVPGIQFQSDTEISGVSTATIQDSEGVPVSDGTQTITYDLVAKDTNGDGTPDQWDWVGVAK
ncbi:MAG TPA: hypothetical protein VHZ98_10405 [Galbitalea sp.]|nr:hypothetical protein [Galbitalea sp.]